MENYIPVYRAVANNYRTQASPVGEVPRRGGGVYENRGIAITFGSVNPSVSFADSSPARGAFGAFIIRNCSINRNLKVLLALEAKIYYNEKKYRKVSVLP